MRVLVRREALCRQSIPTCLVPGTRMMRPTAADKGRSRCAESRRGGKRSIANHFFTGIGVIHIIRGTHFLLLPRPSFASSLEMESYSRSFVVSTPY